MMKNLLKILFLALTLSIISCGENNKTQNTTKSNCSSYDAKQALINDLTKRGIGDYNCSLVSGDDQECNYIFQIISYDGSQSKMNINKKNGSWEINFVN